jgi:hypothetical protein
MPKKTKKMKQRAAQRREMLGTYQPASAEPSPAKDAAVVSTRPAFASARAAATTFSYDYSHVYSDLKRIALLAGFFFAVLIVLSFVIK